MIVDTDEEEVSISLIPNNGPVRLDFGTPRALNRWLCLSTPPFWSRDYIEI